MIIWLASYPKSGNTWLRMFLKSYFLKPNEEFSLDRSINDTFKPQAFPDQKILEPEVIGVFNQGYYQLTMSVAGTYRTKETGNCLLMGYGLIGENMRFILPKDAILTAIKIRANTTMMLSHLVWHASHYNIYPGATWENTHPSKIINFDELRPFKE